MAVAAEIEKLAEELDLLADSEQLVDCCPRCWSSAVRARVTKEPKYKCHYCEHEFAETIERPPIDKNGPRNRSWHDDHVPPPESDDFFDGIEPEEPACSHLPEYQTADGCLRCDLVAFAVADQSLKSSLTRDSAGSPV